MSTEQTSAMNEPTELSSPESRIARFDEYYDVRTFSYVYRKTNKPMKMSKKLNRKNPVLIVRRRMNSKGQHVSTDIDIKSKALHSVLMDLNKDVEGLDLLLSTPECEPSLFFFSFKGLSNRSEKEKSKNEPNQDLISDISVALTFAEGHFANTFSDLQNLLPHFITWDHLWAIFSPNTYIYHYHSHTEQPRVLRLNQFYIRQQEDGRKIAFLSCDYIANDGESFGAVQCTVTVTEEYTGARRIQDLEAYPLTYHEDSTGMRERAIARGRKIVDMDLGGRAYREVKGVGVSELEVNDKTVFRKFNTYGRVMIDPAAFRRFQPNSELQSQVSRPRDRNKLKEEEYLICSPILMGFCFGVKMWGGFSMDRLEPVMWSDEAFRSLVLGEKQKTLIQSLVKQHEKRANIFDDFVIGKGKGVVGLLSGPPGCGKTLTAEAVAEVTHRPLYVISAGELGTRPENVDVKLTQILELAQTWNAVLLLDEAEVFLQQRSTTDVHRNALVSIFLRQLEYYQGILILTTNLITQCDAAFESRIHFSISYSTLGFSARRAIWTTFIGKTTIEREISEEEIDELAKEEMNGRQIKNAVSSAQSIALEGQVPFSIEHVRVVLEVARDWDKARAVKDENSVGVTGSGTV